MKKVLLITGSYPPDICGVGDYTFKLVSFLRTFIDINVYKFNNCSLFGFIDLVKWICKLKPNVIHLQYPTEGYGYSLYPQFLSILFGRKMIVTLHEFSNKSFSGKLAIYIFFIFTKKIIFTTQYELNYSISKAPFIRNKSKIIRIGSNIPFIKPSTTKLWDVVYFGHIRPLKGIENFLKMAELNIKNNSKLKMLIIGQRLSNYQKYFEWVEEECMRLNVKIEESLVELDIADRLSKSKFAYLTFPDGISFRRGSFLAAFGNGCRIISNTKGETDNILLNVILTAESVLEAFDLIINDKNILKNEHLSNELLESIKWENIAKEHIVQFEIE